MEEQLLKSKTDCVYFLASPFTCKKGVECEYRHSDLARLNPHDCWYWLSGNCLNPACAFRHPPLDVHNEASNEPAPPNNQSSVAATKTTVPCYFYYNGFCNKGDKCPFLHEPSHAFGWNPKIANATAIPLDNKTLGGVHAGHIPAENPSVPSEMAMAPGSALHGEQKLLAQESAVIISKPNSSEQIYTPRCEEIATIKTVSLQPLEGLTKSEGEPSLGSDQSSEELIDGNIVRDEWESSPGFDVLVDGRTEEDMVYEDDPEYLHALDGNNDGERIYIPHGFARETECDKNGPYDSSEYLQDDLRTDRREYISRHRRHRNARHVARKRNFLCVESPVGDRHDVDLRDYLTKRRMVDEIFETCDSRHELVHVRDGDRQERYHRYGSAQRVHGRLTSKVERIGVGLSRRRNSVVDSEQRSRPRNAHHNGVRQYNERQSRQPFTERSSYSKRKIYVQDPTTFSKPKSLAEIKEDRKLGHFNKDGLVDFEGPKPLSEILKDKKKMASTPDGFMSGGN